MYNANIMYDSIFIFTHDVSVDGVIVVASIVVGLFMLSCSCLRYALVTLFWMLSYMLGILFGLFTYCTNSTAQAHL